MPFWLLVVVNPSRLRGISVDDQNEPECNPAGRAARSPMWWPTKEVSGERTGEGFDRGWCAAHPGNCLFEVLVACQWGLLRRDRAHAHDQRREGDGQRDQGRHWYEQLHAQPRQRPWRLLLRADGAERLPGPE